MRVPRVEIATVTDAVVVQRSGAVAWVTISRPEVRNALNVEVCERLALTVTALGQDPGIRVVVLRGAGDRVFVSGADVREFREKLATPDTALAYDETIEQLSRAIEAIPKPVVAMIQGHAIGSGCTLAMACDLRVASARARFGIPVAKIGLITSVPDTDRLVDLVGPSRARWLLMTGELITAEEALAIGLVNRVVPAAELETVTAALADTLAANAPLSLQATKQMVLRRRDQTAAVRDGARWYAEIFGSRDLQEGIDAFFDKRRPVFVGR